MKKNLPKIIIITFLSVFIIQMIGLVALTIVPRETKAANEKPIEFKVQVPLPNSKTFGLDKDGEIATTTVSGTTIGNYIVDIYKYAIGIVGILASIILMYGGVIWITAMGSAERISEAQSWIKAAITGTVLALSSYMILYIVNPDLVSFKSLDIENVGTVTNGCCAYTENGVNKNEQMSKNTCESKNPKGSFVEGECTAKTTTTPTPPTDCESRTMNNCETTIGCYLYEGKCKTSSGLACYKDEDCPDCISARGEVGRKRCTTLGSSTYNCQCFY